MFETKPIFEVEFAGDLGLVCLNLSSPCFSFHFCLEGSGSENSNIYSFTDHLRASRVSGSEEGVRRAEVNGAGMMPWGAYPPSLWSPQWDPHSWDAHHRPWGAGKKYWNFSFNFFQLLCVSEHVYQNSSTGMKKTDKYTCTGGAPPILPVVCMWSKKYLEAC